ncbi:MAG: molybdopterin molybdotransferase MoeA [Hyphomicrobiales bacterium]|nr:molybdopterin molybdotransferase MoeA [Hyphomicrobiales bacterium]
MALLPVSDALAAILEGASRLGAEYIPVHKAGGRVLAQDLAARITQPPFDSAAMDGYAVRASDLDEFERLEVIGESAAGLPLCGRVERGQAARIFTGAVVPQGADCVVMQENVERAGSVVRITQKPAPGANIRPAGVDFREGDVLLREGRRLTARDLMLAAGMNYGSLSVTRKPLVAIVATGDELISPGGVLAPGQIVSSSPAGLAAMVAQSGGEPWLLDIARDSLDGLAARIEQARPADILVTIGGASVGDHDLVGRALAHAGATFHFHKVAMRPGKPLLFARMDETRVLGLPGNPVSTLICARIFLQPLIHRLTNFGGSGQRLTKGILDAALPSNGDRTHYMRGRITGGPLGAPLVRVLECQDSSLMSALASSDCLIVRQPGAVAAEVGHIVDILSLDF